VFPVERGAGLCLTNTHRHSGAKTAVIRITRVYDVASAEVSDDGSGTPAETLAEAQMGGAGVGWINHSLPSEPP
jgi:signal transduction histidine kinase